ncbi:hypothetical protein [Cellulomonas chitinilytica]|nr:hypothetical protein [Cellulomonas chitinilytica]
MALRRPSCAPYLAGGVLLTPPAPVLICLGYVKSAGPWQGTTDVDPGTPFTVIGVLLLVAGVVLAAIGVYLLADTLDALRPQRRERSLHELLGPLAVDADALPAAD